MYFNIIATGLVEFVQDSSLLIVSLSFCEAQDEDEIIDSESLQFDFATIKTATENFSEANKLGEGGFGPVYKVFVLVNQFS